MTSASHVVLPGSQRRPSRGAHALGVADPDEWLEVTVKLRRKAPLPPVTGHPETSLPRAELAEKYGSSDEDIQKVRTAFKSLGLEVSEGNRATRDVRVSGPIHAIEAAFQVKLMHYAHDRGVYRGRVGNIEIPAELKDIVVGVFGLDDRPVVKRKRVSAGIASLPKAVLHRRVQSRSNSSTAQRSWFYPGDLADIYDFPPGNGKGQSIGLLEFGGGYFPSDLDAFCKQATVSVPKVVPISVDNQPTDAKDGAEDEVMLDIEVVAGVCPAASIPVYFAPFSEQGWVDILATAVQDQQNAPTVLSVSWGMAEDDPSWSQNAIDTINDTLHEAALAGITVCVAAGDDGSGDQETDGHAHVDFPSSSPFVLAVGGTSLRIRGGTRTEVAWKDGDGIRADGGGSTGGGVSVHFPRPTWQNVHIPSVNPGSIDGRVVPDVAADAQSDGRTTGYFYYVDGQAGLNGGTSASAPLWASLIARMNAALGGGRTLGFVTPLLYQNLAGGAGAVGVIGFNDITSGNNDTAAVGGYSAMPGFDAVSGWGSPKGVALLNALRQVLALPVAPPPAIP